MAVKIRRNEGLDRREVHFWIERATQPDDGGIHVFLVRYRLPDDLAATSVTVMWFRRERDGAARPFGSRSITVDPAVDDPLLLELALAEAVGPDDVARVMPHLRADLWPF